ncbi:MAG: purine-binding chemotaxis protein CheW [Gammaproteobacteria bacterium]|nr:purine-binding chemotaxis protein CheW [Gammaproteobacteria bacterium]
MVAAESPSAPYALLKEIETRSRTKALGLPQQVEMQRSWSGIGFRVGELLLVAPLEEVSEILIFPTLTRVPQVKPWVRGVANVRGLLMPIIDLRGYIEGGLTELGRRSRVLVVHYNKLAVGLLVDDALGLRHFFDEERVGGLSSLPELYKEYIVGGYKQGNTQWGVFSVRNLVAAKKFMEVAARL